MNYYTRPGSVTTELQDIGVVAYTLSTRTTGRLRTIHWRLTDIMNAVDQDFVLVHEAVVQPLHGAAGDEMSTSWSLLRKDSIVLLQVEQAVAGQELPPARQALQVERAPLHAKVEAWPFMLDGFLHLPPEVDLLHYVHDPHRHFAPMTDVSVKYQPSPLLSFKSPFLLINRNRIEVILDVAQVGRTPQPDPDMAPAPIVDTELSGTRAAELLAATTIFKVVDLPRLTQVCNELCRGKRMSRKLVEKGADVFEQGDRGDSMYVVESGSLEAVLDDPAALTKHQLAVFSPSDIFGEMAILGDGRRTATVKALQDSSLVAVHEDAVQTLIQRFPTASTRLLTLILARRGSIHAVQRSMVPG